MRNILLNLERSSAKLWGYPLNNALQRVVEEAGQTPSVNTKNISKNKTLHDFVFAADLTFRFDSDFSGEQAHV